MIEWVPILAGAAYLAAALPVEAFRNGNIKAGDKLPLLVKRKKTKAGYMMIYKLPPGLPSKKIIDSKDIIETATNSTAKIWFENGLLYMTLEMQKIPRRMEFEFEEFPGEMELPLPVGYGRNGRTWFNLAKGPHVSVNGTTGSGKSTLLHQWAVTLLNLNHINHVAIELFIIDLKRLEFSYLKNHAWYAYRLSEAVKILEFLTAEMHRRLEILDLAGCSNIAEYDGEEYLPYQVLFVDELSQLNPDGEKDKKLKQTKEHTHHLLSDLAALARAARSYYSSWDAKSEYTG